LVVGSGVFADGRLRRSLVVCARMAAVEASEVRFREAFAFGT
jgi:hypothetical protein